MIFARTFFYFVLNLPLLVIMTVYALPRLKPGFDPSPTLPTYPPKPSAPSLICPSGQSPACCNMLAFGLAGKL